MLRCLFGNYIWHNNIKSKCVFIIIFMLSSSYSMDLLRSYFFKNEPLIFFTLSESLFNVLIKGESKLMRKMSKKCSTDQTFILK